MHPVGSVFLLRAAPDVAQQSNPSMVSFNMTGILIDSCFSNGR